MKNNNLSVGYGTTCHCGPYISEEKCRASTGIEAPLNTYQPFPSSVSHWTTSYPRIPPSSHIPTSSNTVIATPLLSTSSRYTFPPLPVHLIDTSKYITVLTSLINAADTWPTPPALSPVCTLPHRSCRNASSPFPLRLCHFIFLLFFLPFAVFFFSPVYLSVTLPTYWSACKLLK